LFGGESRCERYLFDSSGARNGRYLVDGYDGRKRMFVATIDCLSWEVEVVEWPVVIKPVW
jgi:hypothetical protein